MKYKDIVIVYKLGENKIVKTGSVEECGDFIKKLSSELNCGLYRYWCENDIHYYDIGPYVCFSFSKIF